MRFENTHKFMLLELECLTYSTAHSKKMTIVFRMLFISVDPVLHYPLPVLHRHIACCVGCFTRFNLLFTLPIILFDKMPILYAAVHSLALCLVLFYSVAVAVLK